MVFVEPDAIIGGICRKGRVVTLAVELVGTGISVGPEQKLVLFMTL